MFNWKKRLKRFIVIYFVLIILFSYLVYSEKPGGGGGKFPDGKLPNIPSTEVKGATDVSPISGAGAHVGSATSATNTQTGTTYENLRDVEFNPDGTVKSAEQITVNSNNFQDVESFNVDSNGNILAQYLVMNAIRDSTFTMVNPINKCKAVFNIPSGGKITISNRDKTKFETISSSGIKQGLACQCSAGISFTAKENNAKLTVASSEKEDVHRYDMENLCMDYSNNKDYKETFCSKAENSFSKLSCASGIDSLGLGKEAYYKYISEKDNKKNFEIIAPLESSGISAILLKTGAKYQESESSSVIDLVKQDFILKNIIEFKNYLDYSVYKGFSKDNIAEFKIENGIVKNLELTNNVVKKDSNSKVAEVYPNEDIIINEYGDKLIIKSNYKTCNNSFFKSYTPKFGADLGEFWMDNTTLNLDTKLVRSHRFRCYNPDIKNAEWYKRALQQLKIAGEL